MSDRNERLAALNRDANRLQAEVEQLKQTPDAAEQLDELALEHVRASGGTTTYSEAVKAMRAAHPELASQFAASFGCRKTAIRT